MHLIFLDFPRETLTSRRGGGLLSRKGLKQQTLIRSVAVIAPQVFTLPDIFLGRAEKEGILGGSPFGPLDRLFKFLVLSPLKIYKHRVRIAFF